MSEDGLDLDAYLTRIALPDRPDATIDGLRRVVAAHVATIPFENIDVLLGRPPKLDVASLQTKMIKAKRGGYCFEQNGLLRAALDALGFATTGLIARVVRGAPPGSARPASHMVIRVDFPEGPFLADVGFGNLTPTRPLKLAPMLEQPTQNETMRLFPFDAELVLQAKIGDDWDNLWRLCTQPVLDIDYEVANWFTATHPASPFVGNMIVARPGPDGARHTFLNGRLSVRRPGVPLERTKLSDAGIAEALATDFGLDLPSDDLAASLAILERTSRRGVGHPAFI